MDEKTRGNTKENYKNPEVLEILNDEKEENKEVMERKTQNCFMCVKNSSEKPNNQVVIEN